MRGREGEGQDYKWSVCIAQTWREDDYFNRFHSS